mmetsp:Transcript_4096/g.11452  ORF Transcript_4096/g.11452 Transcript_4096/m.11452 type:complete len:116 (-) Transcript_4096:92-439(-)
MRVAVDDILLRRDEERATEERHHKELAAAAEEGRRREADASRLRYANMSNLGEAEAIRLLHQETGFPGFGLFNLFVDFLACFKPRDEVLEELVLGGIPVTRKPTLNTLGSFHIWI